MPELKKNDVIRELEAKLALLKEKKARLDDEAIEYADKRDRLNAKVKDARAEIEQLRDQRDEVNERVRVFKQRRNELTSKIKERIEEIKRLGDRSRDIAKKRPSRNHQSLQEEVESIDWQIQTTPHTLQEDKELVGKVRELESQLDVYRKYEQLKKKTNDLRVEVGNLRAESKGCHESLTANAKKSQELHASMLEKVGESKRLRTEADAQHRQFVTSRENGKPLQDEIAAVLGEIKKLKGEMRQEEEKERKQNEDELRQAIESKAKEKLRRGEKLSWEEFQLLAEKGIPTQD